MKVVIAIDSFKGSLSSLQAGKAAAEGIHRVKPEAETVVRTLADGGEGTVQALTEGLGGRFVSVPVTGPAGKTVLCQYGVIEQTHTAVIEMSGAAGITLVSGAERNPLYTTTYGVGEVIRDAVLRGCRHFIVGIGGSATNDGGIGMLQALGFGMLAADGKQVPFGAIGLESLAAITTAHVLPELSECTFRIACDVTNPLCGSEGCSHVFGPQKGATPEIATRMDADIARFAALAERFTGKAAALLPGAGAAGGLGFAFHTFLNGSLTPGITLVLEAIHIADALPSADLVITGEGRMDHQTAMGKAPVGVAQLAKRCAPSCRTIALCGCAAEEAASVNEHGIDAYFPILHEAMDAEEAMRKDVTTANLRQTVTQVLRLIHD